MNHRRNIVHIDMDAFFAAVEQRDNPALRGKPVVIGADPKGGTGRGVVSTCSYEARQYGIRSALAISEAYRRCPQAIFLPPDMEKYVAVSHELMRILYDFTPDIQPIGIDEAFCDITASAHLFGGPRKTCYAMKARIRRELDLTASVGLAPIMLAAKIASDLEKPDGFVAVPANGVREFLAPLPIERLWGVGKKTAEILHAAKMRTIGDIAAHTVRDMETYLGASGIQLWQLANGVDERVVSCDVEAQSISNEYTFSKDTADKKLIEGRLLRLCEKVSARLRADAVCGRTITVRIRYKDFSTYTRSVTIPQATAFADVMYVHVLQLWDKVTKHYPRQSYVRLVGVKMSKLVSAHAAGSLFDGAEEHARARIHQAIDGITERFGDAAIYRGGHAS